MMQFVNRCLLRIEKKILDSSTLEIYHGIRICALNFDESDDRVFLKWTKEALDLIESKSKPLFNRIIREFSYITNTELISAGSYNRVFKRCNVDFSRFYSLPDDKQEWHYEWYFYSFVSTIIHEATHGYLESRGIKYIPANRIRIEKICQGESIRLLKKLHLPVINELINSSEFNIFAFERQWHLSRLDRVRLLLRRIKESKELYRRRLRARVR